MIKLNERQQAFILSLGTCFNIILGEVGYKCDTYQERAEVLEALETFYNGLHKASLEIAEDDNGTENDSKKL
jgi:hypothetical protein